MLSGAGTAYPSGAPEFTPGFKWDSCYSIFSFMCMFCRSCLSFCPFSFVHCVICPSIYGFWLPPLVTSNSSYYGSTKYQHDCGHFCHVIPVNDERSTGFNFVFVNNLRQIGGLLQVFWFVSNLTPSCDNYYRITNMGA